MGIVLNNSANTDILTDLGQFVKNLFHDLTSGLLFLGGPIDMLIAFVDILATALVIYYVLKLLRDSRAWQLLKGLVLIMSFAIICSLAGLNTVGFLMNNTLSVLAIAFVVIFQPELRRALETVGRSSFNVISSAMTPEERQHSQSSIHSLIESIVRACQQMSDSKTGALIIIERKTRLGELIEQENVVHLDAAVTTTMLLQVFYKGSPLHDGAALIRNGRLAAARVHVPLSDNIHLRRDYGTRHRAAVGASEMGDAIAIVVSEERGTISVAMDGRLFGLENADRLRTLLYRQLSPERTPSSFVGHLFRGGKSKRSGEPDPQSANAAWPQEEVKPKRGVKSRVVLAIFSLFIAIVLWLYVQVTINPIESRSFSVPLRYQGEQIAESKGFKLQYPLQNVQVMLMGRRKTIDKLTSTDINAFLDLAEIEDSGLTRLDVQVDTSTIQYLRTTYKSPSSVMINVYTEIAPED